MLTRRTRVGLSRDVLHQSCFPCMGLAMRGCASRSPAVVNTWTWRFSAHTCDAVRGQCSTHRDTLQLGVHLIDHTHSSGSQDPQEVIARNTTQLLRRVSRVAQPTLALPWQPLVLLFRQLEIGPGAAGAAGNRGCITDSCGGFCGIGRRGRRGLTCQQP